MVLYPRKAGKYDKKATIAEAQPDRLNNPDAKFQNTTKTVIPLPQAEAGWSWTNVTKEMKEQSAYKTLRKEWKTATGFYKRLEEMKKKGKK
jgi:hypothetical protein